MSLKLTHLSRILALSFLTYTLTSHALEITRQDGFVTISGDTDFKDRDALREALVGAKGLIVRPIHTRGITPFHLFPALAKIITDSKVPTICAGACAQIDTYLWMAGVTRYFGTYPGAQPGYIWVSGLASGAGNNWSGNYVLFDTQLPEAMPRSLLSRYTVQAQLPKGLFVTQPTEAYPEGRLLECSDSYDSKTCQFNGLTSVATGWISSAAPIPVPAPVPSATTQSNEARMQKLETLAQQGDVRAQVMLGGTLIYGYDAVKDEARGLYWMKKAAEQNQPIALAQMAIAYGRGVFGVTRDDVESRAYTNAALLALDEAPWNSPTERKGNRENVAVAVMTRAALSANAGDADAAVKDYCLALELDPAYKAAQRALEQSGKTCP